MPAIRPERISNRVRLAYKIRALVFRLVAEDRAVDSVLTAVIDEDPPHEHGVSVLSSQHNLFAWADELIVVSLPPVLVDVSGVVPLVEFRAVKIAVLC